MEQLEKKIVLVKYFLIAGLLLFIAGLLFSGKNSSADIEQVAQKVEQSIDMGSLSRADNRMVKRLYGLNANDYEGVALYVSDSNMKVEEILIVKLADNAQTEEVQSAVQGRLDRQLDSFEGYGPQQCALLEDHVLDTAGNYILYAVHQDAAAADQAFRKSL